MRSGSSTLLKITGLLGVTLVSFWIALRIFDYWDRSTTDSARPVPSAPNIIHITEATYGLNCRGFTVAPGQVNRVKEGNATAPIARLCESAIEDCSFIADVRELGDPAPGCPKDLSIAWRCSRDDEPHRLHVAEEAHSKRVKIMCSTW